MQRSKIGLLIAAVAAFGAYKYSKMTPEEKTALKTRGRDFLNKNLEDLNNLFGKTKTTTNGSSGF